MDVPAQTTVYLKDYTPAPFLIPEVDLDIDLVGEDDARVAAKLVVDRNRKAADPAAALRLDLDEITVESVAIDGTTLAPDRYTLDDRHLTLPGVPDAFSLTTVSRINPKRNTKLMGIYTSSTGFFSLCEARRLPAHHAVPRPAGRDGQVHRDAARRQGSLSRAARQRQPRRARR